MFSAKCESCSLEQCRGECSLAFVEGSVGYGEQLSECQCKRGKCQEIAEMALFQLRNVCECCNFITFRAFSGWFAECFCKKGSYWKQTDGQLKNKRLQRPVVEPRWYGCQGIAKHVCCIWSSYHKHQINKQKWEKKHVCMFTLLTAARVVTLAFCIPSELWKGCNA